MNKNTQYTKEYYTNNKECDLTTKQLNFLVAFNMRGYIKKKDFNKNLIWLSDIMNVEPETIINEWNNFDGEFKEYKF